MKRTPLDQSIAQAVSERLSVGWVGSGWGAEDEQWGEGTLNGQGWGTPGDFPTVGMDILCRE